MANPVLGEMGKKKGRKLHSHHLLSGYYILFTVRHINKGMEDIIAAFKDLLFNLGFRANSL